MPSSSPDSIEDSSAKPESLGSVWWEAIGRSKGRLIAVTAFIAAYATFQKYFLEALQSLGIGQASHFGVAIAVVLLSVAVTWYLREVRRLKHRTLTRPLTVFLGSHSFTAREKDRFFGRENEIEEVSRRLALPELSFFILFGESGCGKTSLIRAGLMPKLESEYNFATFYIRLYREPERWLRAALETGSRDPRNGQGGSAVEGDARSGSPNSLFEEAIKLAATLGKTLVLFVDQFEEFFNNQVPVDEEQRVLEFVRSCLNPQTNVRVKLIFSIRSDYFDRMSLFDGFVEDVFTQTNRFRLDVFDRERAKTVIRSSLEYSRKEKQDVVWRDSLIDAVVDDLMASRRDTVRPEGRAIVLPAELQIVCQTLQLRGTTDASQYPGKRRLIRDYVNEAIESSPNREQTLRILQTLIAHDGRSRTEPQTAGAIAEKSGGQQETVARLLRYLDETWRLLTSSRVLDGAKPAVVYELAHEYLAGIILGLSGVVLDKQRRADILLQEYSSHTAYSQSRRIPILDCWLIRRYATEEISPEMRQLIRQSQRQFALAFGLSLALPAGAILAVRQGGEHIEVEYIHDYPHVVVKRGLPVLKPLLGSYAISVDTGLSPFDFLDADASCKSDYWIAPWAALRQPWADHLNDCRVRALLSRMNNAIRDRNYSKAGELLQSLVQFHRLDARVISALRSLVKISDTDSDSWPARAEAAQGLALGAASALIDLNSADDQVAANLQEHLQEELKTGNHNDVSFALKLLKRLNYNQAQIAATLRNRLRDSDSYEASEFIEEIGAFGLRDEETVRALWGYVQSGDPESALAAARVLKQLKVPIPLPLPPLGNGSEEPVSLWFKAGALVELGVRNDEIVMVLKKFLRSGDPEVVLTAAEELIKCGVLDSEVTDALHGLLNVETKKIVLSAADLMVHQGIKDDRLTATLLDRLKLDDPVVDVSHLLSELKTPPEQVAPVFQERLRRGNFRYKTLEAIRDYPVRDPQTLSLVRSLLESSDAVAAACTLIGFNAADESVWLKLKKLLPAGGNRDMVLKFGGCKLTDPRTANIFRDLLSSQDADVVGMAAEGLVRLGIRDKQIVRALEDATRSGVGNVFITEAWNQYLLAETSMGKGEQFDRLWQELNSTAAETSVLYREAVENAFGALALQELKKGGGQAAIDRIRKAAAGWLDEKAPHHRIAASGILSSVYLQVEVARSQGLLPN